jgi:hypothetical protein
MAVLYFYLDANFESCTSIQAKIAKIDTIINTLLSNIALKSVNTANYVEYSIDTGQTVQRVEYRSPEQVQETIAAYEKQRQYYVNKLLGNKYRNIGGKNLNRGGFC